MFSNSAKVFNAESFAKTEYTMNQHDIHSKLPRAAGGFSFCATCGFAFRRPIFAVRLRHQEKAKSNCGHQ
jgi:hypothetical protein